MLGWSIQLFRIRGIRIAVHFSFLLLLAYAAWEGWAENADVRWAGLAANVGFILLLFGCIVLHELGHSFMARRFGVGVSGILLLPIGGMAEFDSIPREPRREFLISLAGPAVNFVIAAGFMPWIGWPADWSGTTIELSARGIGDLILRINLVMGVFNLVPVFPMDGGRILRAVLAARRPYLQATFWAAIIGKVLSVAGVILMLTVWSNPIGALLFAFIFLAGELEYRAVRRQEIEAARLAALLRHHYFGAMAAEPGLQAVSRAADRADAPSGNAPPPSSIPPAAG